MTGSWIILRPTREVRRRPSPTADTRYVITVTSGDSGLTAIVTVNGRPSSPVASAVSFPPAAPSPQHVRTGSWRPSWLKHKVGERGLQTSACDDDVIPTASRADIPADEIPMPNRIEPVADAVERGRRDAAELSVDAEDTLSTVTVQLHGRDTRSHV